MQRVSIKGLDGAIVVVDVVLKRKRARRQTHTTAQIRLKQTFHGFG
jgi:hypothetical protein